MFMQDRLYPHYLSLEVLKQQAEAMDIPIVLKRTTSEEYRQDYIKMLQEYKKEGIDGGIFGDVSIGNSHAAGHYQWIEDVCQEVGMEIVLPLWDQDRESILIDLISSGFKAIIIAADDRKLGRSWLGREFDLELLAKLKKLHANSKDGKVGLYHTLVLDGPLFKKRLEVVETSIVHKRYGQFKGKPTLFPFWYLDIEKSKLVEK
jgi:uncharacterized protein (TIGR00290 family)